MYPSHACYASWGIEVLVGSLSVELLNLSTQVFLPIRLPVRSKLSLKFSTQIIRTRKRRSESAGILSKEVFTSECVGLSCSYPDAGHASKEEN